MIKVSFILQVCLGLNLPEAVIISHYPVYYLGSPCSKKKEPFLKEFLVLHTRKSKVLLQDMRSCHSVDVNPGQEQAYGVCHSESQFVCMLKLHGYFLKLQISGDTQTIKLQCLGMEHRY